MASPAPRPLSPHIQIYRWPLNMALSILHRISGGALAVGLLMMTWFLCALATGPDAFDTFMTFCGSTIGTLMLAGWLAAACYHLCSGLRHLVFDTGRLFDQKYANRAGQIVLGTSALLFAALLAHAMGCF
jgi:succinate dehydrogenase / fumarate reductase cytochrome b subunit